MGKLPNTNIWRKNKKLFNLSMLVCIQDCQSLKCHRTNHIYDISHYLLFAIFQKGYSPHFKFICIILLLHYFTLIKLIFFPFSISIVSTLLLRLHKNFKTPKIFVINLLYLINYCEDK
jgi:hypothetical protein